MIRLTPLFLIGNAIFYCILAAAYCRILKRRFSWLVTLLGFLIGFLAYVLPPELMPYADMERVLFALVTVPLTPIFCSGTNGINPCSALPSHWSPCRCRICSRSPFC